MTYVYANSYYNTDFNPGDRVLFTQTRRGRSSFGTVQEPEVPGGTQYIRVLFDGEKHAGNCHPFDLEHI